MTWPVTTPHIDGAGTARFGHENAATAFQMHEHLIMHHGVAPYPEGALTPAQQLARHAEEHTTAASHLHGLPAE